MEVCLRCIFGLAESMRALLDSSFILPSTPPEERRMKKSYREKKGNIWTDVVQVTHRLAIRTSTKVVYGHAASSVSIAV